MLCLELCRLSVRGLRTAHEWKERPMARYTTTIESHLAPEAAFAYMAEFSKACQWDPSVSEARRVGDGPLAKGTVFDLVARFGKRDVPLSYEIVEYDSPKRVVLEARR